jgi:ABC-2 type transport system permease protein
MFSAAPSDSALAAAVRGQFGNRTAPPADGAWPLQHPVVYTLLFCATLLAVVVPLTIHRYRVRTSD